MVCTAPFSDSGASAALLPRRSRAPTSLNRLLEILLVHALHETTPQRRWQPPVPDSYRKVDSSQLPELLVTQGPMTLGVKAHSAAHSVALFDLDASTRAKSSISRTMYSAQARFSSEKVSGTGAAVPPSPLSPPSNAIV